MPDTWCMDFIPFLKKKGNKPPSNCKLGYIFLTLFLQQILFGLIYEKPETSANVDGWDPSSRGLLGERAFTKAAVAMGCTLLKLITGEMCHASVRAGPFLSPCPQRPKAADPMIGWCWNNKNGGATALPAEISLHCSLCPCGLQPHPPLGARSTVGLSNTWAQSRDWVQLCCL